jgi:hypothetical protein
MLQKKGIRLGASVCCGTRTGEVPGPRETAVQKLRRPGFRGRRQTTIAGTTKRLLEYTSTLS